MKTRGLLLALAITGVLCFSIQGAFAKTAGCPCSPCKCSPCTCGGKSSSSGGGGGKHADHHGGDHHGDHHSHHGGGLGVGGTIDLNELGTGLGRLLQRPTQSRSTPVAKSPSPVAHTEEKRISKHKEKNPAPNSFDDIKLTGQDAKDENNPPNTFNVDNDGPKVAESPAPGTEEKPKKGNKPKPSWSKPIQDWLDARAAVVEAQTAESKVWQAFYQARYKFYDGSAHLKQLQQDSAVACAKAQQEGATKEDKEACEKAKKAVDTQVSELDKDFANSPEGKKLLADAKDADNAVKAAQKAADNAGKDIDAATQKMVLKKMEKWEKNQAKEGKKMAKE
jgi:hypothetical protein